jgi:hypothetical protein
VSLEQYRAFIAARAGNTVKTGFAPRQINPAVKAHQSAVLDFALNAGKSAAFLDTGLGKSLIELEFARQCADETGKPSLILTPPDDVLADLVKIAEFDVYEWQKLASPVWMDIQQGNVLSRIKAAGDERHVCPLQLDVIDKCLRLYSKPGDVVMDPFNGIGSTGYQAIKQYRRYLGFELKPEYARQAGKNLAQAEQSVGDLFGIAAE